MSRGLDYFSHAARGFAQRIARGIAWAFAWANALPGTGCEVVWESERKSGWESEQGSGHGELTLLVRSKAG